MGTLWGTLHDRYGHIVALYAKYLCIKIEFHCKHKEISPNLETPDEVLEKAIAVDINNVNMVTSEIMQNASLYIKGMTSVACDMHFKVLGVFSVMWVLLLYFCARDAVFRQLESNSTSSATPVGQCRLSPLVPVIQDCGPLYHFLVKLLFKLHSRIPVDALLGHRERFRDQFNSLTQFFEKSRSIEFFKTLIQIPDLPDSPPNFLRAASLADHVKPVVVQNLEQLEDDDTETQVDFGEGLGYQMSLIFCILVQDFHSGFHGHFVHVLRDTEVVSLRKELEAVKPELHIFKAEAQRAVVHLKEQVNKLEAELEDQRTQKQMAMVENECLRMEVETLRTQNAVTASIQASAEDAGNSICVAARAQTVQVQFSRLKEKHAELVSRHADLMRKNADTVKQLASTQQAQEEVVRAKEQMAVELEQLKQEKSMKLEAHKAEIVKLKQELQTGKAEITQVQSALQSKEKTGDQLSSVLVGLQAEKEALLRSVREQEAELSSLRQSAHQHQATLLQEREKTQREMGALQIQLQQVLQHKQEQQTEISRLQRELQVLKDQTALHSRNTAGDEMSSVLVGLQAEKEALLRSMREQEAELSSLRQSAHQHQATLLQEREKTQREMGALQIQLQAKSSQEYLLQQKLQEEQFCLLQCAVVEAEGIILDAVAKVDDPMHVCCVCTPEYLINRAETTLVSIDKMQQNHAVYLSNMEDASGLLRAVTQFSHLAADTIVNGAATAHAVPTDQADRLTDSCRDCATHCLQFLRELKLKATLPKADPTAIRYVIQRILSQGQNLRHTDQDAQKAELADLVDMEMTATSTAIEDAVLRMDAIHMLITAATDLQKDVVESGRGAGSAKDFYAKNSCWTEGLISASKAVGWGASRMVESADKVVTDQGKYEELIVCSHEIAASTAQLVAASKVKADRGNKKLHTLQQASRHVNDMAAVVVTSTKTGQMQIEYKDPLDFSGISLIKLKTEEMDSQVRVLELESQLCQERQRLGELRKRHYELAGLSPDQPEEGDFSGFVSVLPPVVPDPPLPELPTPEPPQATPLKVTPSKATPHKVPSKKPSIFQKSGTLLKSAVTLYLNRSIKFRCYKSSVRGAEIRAECAGQTADETDMEDFGSALEKNVADLTVMDVYDIAAVVGQEFERIIDQYGCEALSRLMPKVVRVLEILEVLVSRSSINPETDELRLELDRLRLERTDRLEKEKKHIKELELVEDVWRGEAQDLLSQIAQLQEENKTLLSNLSIKDCPMTEEDIQRQEGMSERERQVMMKLKEVVDKQRDEIRAKDRELTLKNEDIEALQQQQSRLMKINHDLRHKITVVEAQGKALIEQKVELEAFAQARQQELASLRQEVTRLGERLRAEGAGAEEPTAPPSPAQGLLSGPSLSRQQPLSPTPCDRRAHPPENEEDDEALEEEEAVLLWVTLWLARVARFETNLASFPVFTRAED
ncbi:hypothetical protein P4O66_006013 [Electrophorus voltai]|uniref:RILP-like protein 1 n=1 Tax=Electrophorus voltai TaxID=2609070 RepID=A0AAD9E1J7_9TELE|nr:hypothetical protein P4O66_006013 [Electrophorus voltai]